MDLAGYDLKQDSIYFTKGNHKANTFQVTKILYRLVLIQISFAVQVHLVDTLFWDVLAISSRVQ